VTFTTHNFQITVDNFYTFRWIEVFTNTTETLFECEGYELRLDESKASCQYVYQ